MAQINIATTVLIDTLVGSCDTTDSNHAEGVLYTLISYYVLHWYVMGAGIGCLTLSDIIDTSLGYYSTQETTILSISSSVESLCGSKLHEIF